MSDQHRADAALTFAFVGYASERTAKNAREFEDEVLPLLEAHGAKVLFRGHRAVGQDDALPLEIHLLWFPHRGALESYLADDRRQSLVREYGDVFTVKHLVQIDTL